MDTLHIGMRAEYVEDFATRLVMEARKAIANKGDDDTPATFEVEFVATDNDSGAQVTVTFNNDDMEREDVARDEIIVEAD